MFVSYTTYYLAIVALTLADAVTLFYSCPLFVTLLSAPFLAERIGPKRYAAVLVGFAGVVVIMRPGSTLFDPAVLLGVAAAGSYAVSVIITRRLSSSEAGSTMSFYAMVTFIAVSAIVGLVLGDGRFMTEVHPSAAFLFRPWVLPGLRDFLLLAICGLIAGGGFYLLTQAYRVGSPSVVTPFEYTSLPWALLWGYLLWDERPGPATLIGLALILGSGLYIIYREGLRGRPAVSGRSIRPRI